MTKADVFDKKKQDIALFAKVLSHPIRLAILQHLVETKTCISGDISDQLTLSRNIVSHHLKELKVLGLIQGEIDGAKINYCLCSSGISKFKLMLDEFLKDMTTMNIKRDVNCDVNYN